MEKMDKPLPTEANISKTPESLDVGANTDPSIASYSSKPENNPLSEKFMTEYGVEYKDPQSLAVNPDKPCPETSVVIPIHNEGESVLGLVESLSAQAKAKNAEVVLVINNDTAGTKDAIEKAIAEGKIDGSAFRIVECSYETKEQDGRKIGGVGLARKIGMDYAVSSGAESIISLDADWKVGADFLGSVQQSMESGIDGVTFKTEGIAEDEASREYVQMMEGIRKYRTVVSGEAAEAPQDSALDKNTGAIHAVRSAAYAKAGGMVPVISGEDGRFGAKVSESGALLKQSEIKVGVEIRESDTPGGQGESLKKFKEGFVENPDKAGEYIPIDEAKRAMAENKEFQASQEKERKIEEISEGLIQELTSFFNLNKEKLQTLEISDIETIRQDAESRPLISRFVLTEEGDYNQLVETLKDSSTVNQFVEKLRDGIGSQVRERIEASIGS